MLEYLEAPSFLLHEVRHKQNCPKGKKPSEPGREADSATQHSHTAEPRLRTERGRKIAVTTSFSSIESRPHLSSPLEFPRESTRRRCAFLGQETLLSLFGDTLSQDCPTPRTHGVQADCLRSALLALSRLKPTGKRAVQKLETMVVYPSLHKNSSLREWSCGRVVAKSPLLKRNISV